MLLSHTHRRHKNMYEVKKNDNYMSARREFPL